MCVSKDPRLVMVRISTAYTRQELDGKSRWGPSYFFILLKRPVIVRIYRGQRRIPQWIVDCLECAREGERLVKQAD